MAMLSSKYAILLIKGKMSLANLCLSEQTVATTDTDTMNFTIIQTLYLEENVILYYIHLFLINFLTE